MNKLCIAIGIAFAIGCSGPARAPRAATTPVVTPEPAIVGPVLLYTSRSLGDATSPVIDTLVAYDGGAQREVRRTELPAGARAAVLTKRGTLIYVAQPSGSFEVRTIEPLSGGQRTLYAAPHSVEGSIAVSPDGRHLAFAENAAKGDAAASLDTDVRVIDTVAGSARTIATFHDPLAPSFRGRPVPRVWRDDGRGFVVSGDSGGPPGGWATVMLDGTVIDHLQAYASPSPNGRYLVLDDVNDSGCILGDVQRLRIYSLDANAIVAEVDDAARGIVADGWSPDGMILAYRRYDAKPGPLGECLPDYDPVSIRRFTLAAAGGGPVPIVDFAALQRQWYGDRVVDICCGDGSTADVFGRCPDPSEGSLFLNGQRVATGMDLRVLGFIDVGRHRSP